MAESIARTIPHHTYNNNIEGEQQGRGGLMHDPQCQADPRQQIVVVRSRPYTHAGRQGNKSEARRTPISRGSLGTGRWHRIPLLRLLEARYDYQ